MPNDPIIVNDITQASFTIPTGQPGANGSVEVVKFHSGRTFVAGKINGKGHGRQLTNADRVALINFLIDDLNTDDVPDYELRKLKNKAAAIESKEVK